MQGKFGNTIKVVFKKTMLIAKQIKKQLNTGDIKLCILDNVSFSLDVGRSMAIVGESGSGKTTLLGLLAGLDTPTSGDVIIDGASLFDLSEEQRALSRKKNLGFIFQNFQLIEGLTALENVMMPLELKGDSKAQSHAEQMLTRVGLKNRLQHYPNQLSGGEQQRVAIARAFVTKPKLLLADEPTGNLDTHTGEKIIKLMFSLVESLHTTLVLVTHDLKLAEQCDEILRLSAGKVVSEVAHHD
ncbi:MAG: ABC transporter ATP-binding protein [bacterium]